MGHIRIHFLLCIMFLFVIFTCSEAETISSTESQKIQNLRAFAKLYGYVKYFHPSDEASAIDWDKFAIYGAKRVKDAKNTEELKTALEALFLPIAPTIQIYTSDQEPEDPMKHVPDDTTGLKIVAWQHQGLGLQVTPYASIRLNRKNKKMDAKYDPGGLIQLIDATEHRGKEIKLKAFVRTNVTGPGNQAGLWLQVYREGGRKRFVDKMDGRPITSKDWQSYEIVGKVDDDASTIFFGCYLRGIGRLWADEVQLFVKDEGNEWESVRIEHPGFEGDWWEGWWWTLNSAYYCDVVTEKPYKGKKCLLIEGKSVSEPLFEEHPKMGEVVNKPLDSELFCQIPLALYSDENHTLGK
ncbi:MAG: peptidase S41, partial [Planctomycetota bacterium]